MRAISVKAILTNQWALIFGAMLLDLLFNTLPICSLLATSFVFINNTIAKK